VGPQEIESVSEQPEIQARLLAALADVHFHSGSYREQLASAEQAVRMWRAVGDKPPLADALALHGIALRLLGQWQDALGMLREAVSLAEQTGSLFVCAFAWNHIGYAYLQSGQFDEAATAFERGRDLGERIRNVSFYGASRFLLGLHAFYAGDWAAARMWFDHTAASVLDGKAYTVSAYGPLGQGLIRVVTGEREIGLSYLRETIALREQGGMPHIIDRARRELAEAELVMGNAISARRLLEPYVTQPGRQDENDITPMMPLLAWANMDLGEGEDVEALLDRATAQARAHHHALALIDVLRVWGLLYTRQRRWPEATEALEEGLALARGMLCPYAEAKALYVYGRLHMAQGEPERARERFTAASAILDQLGERLYAEHIERALAEIAG